MTDYLHGAEIIEGPLSPRPLSFPDASVIGVVGTAPGGPVSTPTRVESDGDFGSGLGTLPPFLETILGSYKATIVAVNVLDPTSATNKSAVAAKIYALAGDTAQLDDANVRQVVVKNEAASQTYTVKTDYTVDEAAGTVTRVDGGAIAADAKLTINYDKLITTGIAAADIAAGVALLTQSQAEAGKRPKLLGAPGYSDQADVHAKLGEVALRLLATAVVEGTDTNAGDALALRKLIGGKQYFLTDVGVVRTAGAGTAAAPNTASVMLAFLAADREARGPFASPSNRVIPGVVGTTRGIDVGVSDSDTEANELNAGQVNCIVNLQGWRLWGGNTLAQDKRFRQVNVVRTDNYIREAILESHLWAIDRGVDRDYFDAVAGGVNQTLRDLQRDGRIAGGKCWPSELNTPSTIIGEQAYFDYDWFPVIGGTRLTFRVSLNADYIEDVIDLGV